MKTWQNGKIHKICDEFKLKGVYFEKAERKGRFTKYFEKF